MRDAVRDTEVRMSNPVHGTAVFPAVAGHSELITLLTMQSQERMALDKADREERAADRAEMRQTVVDVASSLAALFTALRADKVKADKRDRKEARRREEKEAAREDARLAAKSGAKIGQGTLSEQFEKIDELHTRIDGYEADIRGMSEMLKQYRSAEEKEAPAPSIKVSPMKGFKIRRPYGS